MVTKRQLTMLALAGALASCEKKEPAPILGGTYTLTKVTQAGVTLTPPTVSGTATVTDFDGAKAQLSINVSVQNAPVRFTGTAYVSAKVGSYDLFTDIERRQKFGASIGETLSITAQSGTTQSVLEFKR